MNKKQKIEYLLSKYKEGISSGKTGWKFDICYEVKNKTFCINIGDFQYFLTRNELSDAPDGVGDELTDKIIIWVQNK